MLEKVAQDVLPQPLKTLKTGVGVDETLVSAFQLCCNMAGECSEVAPSWDISTTKAQKKLPTTPTKNNEANTTKNQ